MTAEILLERLERVRSHGAGRWRASCPTAHHKHGDRSRGLSIAETPDGRTLVHCFAGCDVGEILDAVGLQFSDLFPERLEPHRGTGRTQHGRLAASEALDLIAHEAWVVAVAGAALLDGTATPVDVQRVTEAVGRISRIAGECRHG